VFVALAPVLLPLALWLYTLVFILSSLWFAHYTLGALEALRKKKSAPPPAPPPKPEPVKFIMHLEPAPVPPPPPKPAPAPAPPPAPAAPPPRWPSLFDRLRRKR